MAGLLAALGITASAAFAGGTSDTAPSAAGARQAPPLVFRLPGVSATEARRAVRSARLHRRARRSGEAGGAPKVGIAPRRLAPTGRASIAVASSEVAVANSDYPIADCRFGAFELPQVCSDLFDFVFARWRPFDPESPFNRVVPGSPALTQNSSNVVDRVTGFDPMQKVLTGTAGTDEDWSHPIYYGYDDDPVFTVHCSRSSDWGRCEIEGDHVHIPELAEPAGGGDGHLAVVDVGTGEGFGTEYDFWQVKSKPSGGGTLVASYGGKTSVLWNQADGLGSNATAANFGLSAGIIRPEELAHGRINHALFMVVRCTNGESVWPARDSGSGRPCSELGLSNSGAPAMGQHFYLDMSDSQITALAEPAWKKTILRAMAEYGLFVGDTGGASWGIQFQSGSSYTSFGYPDPWVELAKGYDVPAWRNNGRTLYSFDLSDTVNWGSRLSVIAPCVARGIC